jgi:RNA-directed DNA polymerase
LDGLETTIKSATKGQGKIHTVRYADGFIVTANSPEILENWVKPAVNAFLAERGLTLSPEKTHITHINTGFDFLGFNVRKYKEKLLIKPAKANVKSVLAKIRGIIKSQATITANSLIKQLNPVTRGWCNYFRHVVSKRCFSYIDSQVVKMLLRCMRRRHTAKSAAWMKRKYFTRVEDNNWRFFGRYSDKPGIIKNRLLCLASSIKIKRHIKVRAAANPFLKEFKAYFLARSRKVTKISSVWKYWHLLPVQFKRWI